YCRCIEMNTYSGTRAEVMMIGDIRMLLVNRERNPAIQKLLRDKCGRDSGEFECQCYKCWSAGMYNIKVLDMYDIVKAERYCKTCERVTSKCSE
ncbi:hypothetical protein ALC62_15446, partial [Cyphomyrmex costatus]